jgi:methyl-accepting chemotaxis protein
VAAGADDLAPAGLLGPEPAVARVERESREALVLAVPVADVWLVVGFEVEEPGTFEAAVAARPEPLPERPDAFTRAVAALRALLERLRTRVAKHAELLAAIQRHSRTLSELAESIRMFSFNAMIASHRVADGDEIGAVAGLMQTRSDVAAPELHTLVEALERTAAAIRETAFRIAAATLLTELMLARRDPLVAEALATSAERATTGMRELDATLDELADAARGVEHHLAAIRALEVNGRIEAARANDTEHVRMLFEEIGNQVRDAIAGLKNFTVLSWRGIREQGSAQAEARGYTDAIRSAVGPDPSTHGGHL